MLLLRNAFVNPFIRMKRCICWDLTIAIGGLDHLTHT